MFRLELALACGCGRCWNVASVAGNLPVYFLYFLTSLLHFSHSHDSYLLFYCAVLRCSTPWIHVWNAAAGMLLFPGSLRYGDIAKQLVSWINVTNANILWSRRLHTLVCAVPAAKRIPWMSEFCQTLNTWMTEAALEVLRGRTGSHLESEKIVWHSLKQFDTVSIGFNMLQHSHDMWKPW